MISYDSIEDFLFQRVPEFRSYFYILNDESDLEEKYCVMWTFADYFKERWLSADFTVNDEGVRILGVLSEISDCGDPKLDELICIWFVEDLLSDDAENMRRLRACMPNEEMKSCVNELFQFFYRRTL